MFQIGRAKARRVRLGLKNPENESLEVYILSNLLGAGTVGCVGIFTMFMISILEHESFGELNASQKCIIRKLMHHYKHMQSDITVFCLSMPQCC